MRAQCGGGYLLRDRKRCTNQVSVGLWPWLKIVCLGHVNLSLCESCEAYTEKLMRDLDRAFQRGRGDSNPQPPDRQGH